jgi:hypothetical protein
MWWEWGVVDVSGVVGVIGAVDGVEVDRFGIRGTA